MNPRVVALFDGLADRYADFTRSPHHRKLKVELLARIGRSLARGASILDVGSGPGTYAIPLALLGYEVVAIDVSRRMLDKLEAEAGNAGVRVQTICGDAMAELPRARTADAAISVHGPLSYQPDPLPLARAIASKVRPGGPIWFAFPRAAAVEQIARKPARAFAPLIASSPYRCAGGEGLELFLHDPRRLAAALAGVIDVREVFASGVILHAPDAIDRALGRLPILRRLGGTTVIHGSVRPLL